MFTITFQFETLDELRSFTSDFLSTDYDTYTAGPNAPPAVVAKPVDTKVEQAAPAEVVKAAPAKKITSAKKAATKGTAAKKNESQARAAAKLKQQEQAAEETGDLGLDDAPAAPPAAAVTKQDVDKALRAYAGQYQMTGARALIALFKKSDGTPIANARELREEDYAAFVAAAQKPPVIAQEA